MAGIYYLSNLIRSLRALPPDEQPNIVLVCDRESAQVYDESVLAQVELFISDPVSKRRSGRVWARLRQLIIRLIGPTWLRKTIIKGRRARRSAALVDTLAGLHVDAVFPVVQQLGEAPGIRTVAWAWDFQHKHHPELFSQEEIKARDDVFGTLARQCDAVVVSSGNAAEDFNSYLHDYRAKLRVLRFAAVPEERWIAGDPGKVRLKFNLPESYVMLPNQFWRHKNHITAFHAWGLLRKRGRSLTLVCTGHTEDYRHREHFRALQTVLVEEDLLQTVRILGFVDREDHIQLMRGAAAILQPSLFEGWSTVLEEARALGKIAFVSDIPVHVEQDLPNAVYFPPTDAYALADAIGSRCSELVAGPDLAAEAAALSRQSKRILNVAHNFLRIVEEPNQPALS